MNTEPDRQAQQDTAVEFLAREAHVPVKDVLRLYAIELARLGVGAKIKGFLPIFAIRKVRGYLRQHAAAGPAAR